MDVAVGGTGVLVGVAVTMFNPAGGVPVRKAMAVSRASITSAVAWFPAVGVLVTTQAVGVLVAST